MNNTKAKISKGKPKGTKNARTILVEQIAAKYKYDPFEVLIMFAAGDWKSLGYDAEVYHVEKPDGSVKMGYVITPEMRLTAAKEAAQYLHSKKKEQPTPDGDDPIDVTPEQEKQAALEALTFIEQKYPELIKKDE